MAAQLVSAVRCQGGTQYSPVPCSLFFPVVAPSSFSLNFMLFLLSLGSHVPRKHFLPIAFGSLTSF